MAGALLDNYNTIVRDIRDDPSRLASTSEIGQQNAEQSLQANQFQPGALLSAKLANVKITADLSSGSEVVATLAKGEEVVYLGESQDGFVLIQGAEAEGWVREILMKE